ncbi:MAG: molybdopterin-dependent oxidoreductase [Spirochaetia bacterium]|nr:molybdopterin-dependent oxidoreductase [Spirochaetia bacterium]
MKTVYRSCSLCEAICGLEITVENGRVAGIRGDKADVFSHGHICPKGPELKAIHEDPDRLRKPIRRVGNDWHEVSWDEALNEVAEKIHAVQSAHGTDAVAYYAGNPNVHNYGSLLFAPRFIARLKTRNSYSATSVDQLPHHFAAQKMFGHPLLVPVPDVDRTDYFLVMGANPIASNGSMMTAPDIKGRLKEIQKRKGRVIVVDPRKTETVRVADEHVFVRPGSDVYFLLALLHVVFERNLTKLKHLGSEIKGLNEIKSMVMEFSPAQIADVTGIPANVTERIALEFTSAKSAVCYGRVGLSTQAFGGLCQWLINVLNIVTGNMDEPGGAMFPLPAVDTIGSDSKSESYGSFDSFRSKARGLPEFGGELPVAALADEILYTGEGGVRALITSAGNPVLSTPNGGKLQKALGSLKFMASVDIYLNETTRYANIILPPTSPLEHDHYDVIFNILAVRNTARYSPAVFDPPEGSMHDWEIFTELTRRLEEVRSGSKSKKTSRGIKPTDFLDRMLKSGPYGAETRIDLQKLIDNPHGIDFGPLTSVLISRIKTVDRKIDLAPDLMLADLHRLKESMIHTKDQIRAQSGSLVLIGRRHVRDNNSWMHNVAIPHGYGHGRKGSRLGTAAQHSGASINDLTDDESIDVLTGNAAFSGVPVQVRAAG